MPYMPKHKRQTSHYPAPLFRIAALLACLTLVTLYLLSGAYSKFYTSASGGDSARVTRFSPDFTSDKLIVYNKTPGYTDKIDFTVQNFSGDKTPETAMKYTVVLKTTGNIPLTFTLLDGETELQKWEWEEVGGERTYEYTADSPVFAVGTQETVAYRLELKWPDTQNDAKFSGMTDAVYLGVKFEQID